MFVGIVRDFYDGNGIQQLAGRGNAADIGTVVRKVLVCNVTRKAVGDQEIPIAIVVYIGKQGSPAPIGLVNSCKHPHLTEGKARTIVEVQHIAHVLVLVAKLLIVEIGLVHILADGSFLAVAILTEHVYGDEIR